jgi:hypothetical protein
LFDATPPFRPIAISAYPIVDRFFYDGAYSAFKNRGCDYVVFPMGLTQANDTLILSLGRNDCEGMLAKMNTDDLLGSLRPIDHAWVTCHARC